MGYLYFNIQITSGGSGTGPYDIYYDTTNLALLYPNLGLASGLTYNQLSSTVQIYVPDSATSLSVFNTDTNCSSPGNTKTYSIISGNLILLENDLDILLDESGNSLQQE